MKKFFYMLPFLFLISVKQSHSQCSFTPTIDPAQPILCPGGTDTLWTEVYDSYQWFKGSTLIAGATDQFYVVTENDIGKKFKVEATLDTCTEATGSVLVDGYFFLPIFVIHSGDQGQFDPNTYTTILCPGDTMVLTLGTGFNQNVQWYSFGSPIAGATDTFYNITTSGSYSVCSGNSSCPDYIQCLGLTIDVTFSVPSPVIAANNDTLSTGNFDSYQWFLNGVAISGATNQEYVATSSGAYTVQVNDDFGCIGVSAPYDFVATLTGELAKDDDLAMSYNHTTSTLTVNPGGSIVNQISVYNLAGIEMYESSPDSKAMIEIPLQFLLSGLYVVDCRTDSQSHTLRFLKE